MFDFLRTQSKSAAGAILYVTVGTLAMIWAGLWYFYFISPNPNPPAWQSFTCLGIILSGFAVATIGLLFGLIGRGAKAADTTVGVTAQAPVAPVAAARTAVANPAPVDTAPVGAAPIAPVPAGMVQ